MMLARSLRILAQLDYIDFSQQGYVVGVLTLTTKICLVANALLDF